MKLLSITFFAVTTLFILNINQDKALEESIQRGRDIYTDFCITCHMANGEGVAGTFPPLAKSDYLMNNREASIRGIKYGQSGEMTVNGKKYNNFMAPLGLGNDEIADVMNYITNSWDNNNDKMITEEEVSNIKK